MIIKPGLLLICWSDELSSILFASGRRTPKKAYNPECLIPIAQNGGGSVMIWAAISWYYAGLTLSGRVTASDYMDILGNQVHPMVQLLFPNNDAVFLRQFAHTHSQKCSILVLNIHFNVVPGQHNHQT